MSNIKSSLIGFATADALGVPIEFTARNMGKPLTEMVGYGSHNVPEGTWSDDTSMLIAAMDSINNNEGKIDYDKIMTNFLKWVMNAEYTATDVVFDIGIATRKALNNYASGVRPATSCGVTGEKENGNGSLMRILPFVFFAHAHNLNEEETVDLINNASSLTHAHEISRLGCKIYTDYMRGLLDGLDKEASLDNLTNYNYAKYYSEKSLKCYERILNGTIKDAKIDDIKSSGFVVSTLEAALWTTLNNNSYEESVVKAINLGDDTDTVGAITGSINGLIYGEENIPTRWTNKLRKKEYLSTLADRFEVVLNNTASRHL